MDPQKSSSFTIKHWAEGDRPREKLLQKGRQHLTDAELLAILIGSGNKNESAVEVCKKVLSKAGDNLNELGRFTINQLMEVRGIGQVRALTIVAALELGRRRRSSEALEKKKISSSTSVFELMQPKIGELPHEEFWILYLNNSNKVIQELPLSKGGITGTLVDIRLAYKQALNLGATATILVHNHPSGNLNPSAADKQLTQKFKIAGESLDIKVLDHLIITENSYFSFADEGLL
ncbi:RadC family protein [Salinimicrobium sp. TH3]|uniref:RadC family protein n=1 Tax=Salinimicrobium sp. TH3 TaxID=2997342 RepID=UPI002274E85C|nr:DNA repair protein RadC [Salinimicrobium sp. TH3]MCY2688317.1 DNA repair protein RadC [Salinimicrobium sp. TH3]